MVSLKGPGLVGLAVEELGDLRLLQPTPLRGMSQTHCPTVDKVVLGRSSKSRPLSNMFTWIFFLLQTC